MYSENFVNLHNPDARIADYGSITSKYRESVLQAYGKGILDGFEDGAFHGDETLTRAQAAAVVVRTGWVGERLDVEDVEDVTLPESPAPVPWTPPLLRQPRNRAASSTPGATQRGGRIALFGDAGKTYFNGSESNLARLHSHRPGPHLGHRLLRRKVHPHLEPAGQQGRGRRGGGHIEEIYNDPEQFPIHALGGARYTDTMRHSWGCAIDINPVENFHCYTHHPYTAVTGSTCYKYSDSPYCITPDSSVVRTFAKYGWGWGGGTAENGYSGWTTTADYMHFSVRHDGG